MTNNMPTEESDEARFLAIEIAFQLLVEQVEAMASGEPVLANLRADALEIADRVRQRSSGAAVSVANRAEADRLHTEIREHLERLLALPRSDIETS